MTRAKSTCDECQSLYFTLSSKMTSLCPNCANKLYGYPSCDHHFEDGSCVKYGSNGQESDYIREL